MGDLQFSSVGMVEKKCGQNVYQSFPMQILDHRSTTAGTAAEADLKRCDDLKSKKIARFDGISVSDHLPPFLDIPMIGTNLDPCDFGNSEFGYRANSGLDDEGRPQLPNSCNFDLNLTKDETFADGNGEVEETLDQSNVAHQASSDILKGDESFGTSATDWSEFFISPLQIDFSCRPSPVYSGNGILFAANDGDNGDQSKKDDGATSEQPQQELEQQPSENDGGTSGETNQQESSSIPQTSSVVSASTPIPFDQQLEYRHDEQHQLQGGDQSNGGDDVGDVLTTQHSVVGAALLAAPIESQVVKEPPTGGKRPQAQMSPEVALHVVEAIECVVQRARDGPLEMPAFRSQAEKAAASHGHHQPRHQSKQQQMMVNLQMHGVSGLAAHFDLSGAVKAVAEPVRSFGAGSGQGNAALNDPMSSPATLYQYFQPQQAHQTSQGGFAHSPGNAGVVAGSGANYGTWTIVTTNASQPTAVTMANLYSPAMAAQFYPTFTTPTGMNQQLYSAVAGAPLTGFASSPYFSSTQQQQTTAAMYGQYATSGFGGATPQQQQQQQQQNPHDLMDTDRLISGTDGLSVRERLHKIIDDLEMITKQLAEVVTVPRDERGVGKEANATELANLFKIKERDLENALRIATEQAERQKVIDQLEQELRKRDEYLMKIRNCLKDSESLMVNAIFQANQKLKSIALANHQKVSADELIRYAHRISACNAVAAPLTWQQGDPQRPFPIDAEMRSGLLSRVASGDFMQTHMIQASAVPTTPAMMPAGAAPPPNAPGMHPFMAPVVPAHHTPPDSIFPAPHRPFSPTAAMYQGGSMMPPKNMPTGWVAQRALTPPNVSPRALRLPPPPPFHAGSQQHSSPLGHFMGSPVSPMGPTASSVTPPSHMHPPMHHPQSPLVQQQHPMIHNTPQSPFQHQFGSRASPQMMQMFPSQVRPTVSPQIPFRQTSPAAAAIGRMLKHEAPAQHSDTVELLSSDSSSSSSSDSPE